MIHWQLPPRRRPKLHQVVTAIETARTEAAEIAEAIQRIVFQKVQPGT